jgi:hypothetical protein
VHIGYPWHLQHINCVFKAEEAEKAEESRVFGFVSRVRSYSHSINNKKTLLSSAISTSSALKTQFGYEAVHQQPTTDN